MKEGLVLVEGVRCVGEALAAGAQGRFLVRSPRSETLLDDALTGEMGQSGLPVHDVTDEEMQSLAGTEAPQGLLLVAEEPSVDDAAIWDDDVPRVVLLDGIQDPGNVGTLVRVAAAFGCSGVIALDGTADPWSPRAVRAASGTTFRLPVLSRPWTETVRAVEVAPVPLLIAEADGDDVRTATPGGGWVLALGGEGAGCRNELRERSHASISIPMPGGVESLNVGVAGAILLYELTLGNRT